MAIVPYIVAYLGIGVFAIAVIARFVMWSKMPIHMRWELYPVAHEAKKAHYGGSYYEESEWWKKKREVSLIGEMKVMVPEILFLVALKEHNPKLWTRSFPFHFGLYLVGGTTALMMVAGVLGKFGGEAVAPLLGIIARIVPVIGAIGLVLGILGAIGLILRRMGNELRDYTAPMDIFNLVFFVFAFGASFAAFLSNPDFSGISAFVTNLVTFSPGDVAVSGVAAILIPVSAVLLAAITAYIPLTHMSHFVGKYFAYHAIRWADEPNLRGGKHEKAIHEMLAKPITWSAPHIQGDGKKTWLEAATEDQTK